MKLLIKNQQLNLLRILFLMIFGSILSIFSIIQPSYAASEGFEVSNSHHIVILIGLLIVRFWI